MRQLLDLQHHKHTGKVLHHRHTSYRALALIFLVAGVFMVGLDAVNHAAADTFGISAVVDVPVPSTPPTITSPTNNMKLSDSSTLVFGSCPLVTPQVVIVIAVDNVQAGTGACDIRNDFSVPVTIGPGHHQITAGVLTISGQQGPTTTPINVSTTKNLASPVTITADTPFIFANSKHVTWTGTIGSNDQDTDYVHIDWGDNSQSDYTVKSGPQSFTHHYATLISHNLLISAAGSPENTSSEQFAAATSTTFNTAALVSSTKQITPFRPTTIMGLYGLYVTALSITIIIWLEAKHAARAHARQATMI